MEIELQLDHLDNEASPTIFVDRDENTTMLTFRRDWLDVTVFLGPKQVAYLGEHLALWCVHVLGPDDLIATPSKESADLLAAKINKSVGRQWQEGDPEINAIATPWPFSAKAHAKALAEVIAAEQRLADATLCDSCAKANISCPVYPQKTKTCVEYRMKG